MVLLDQRPDGVRDLLGEVGIPLGRLAIFRRSRSARPCRGALKSSLITLEHVTLVFRECHIRLLETDADLRNDDREGACHGRFRPGRVAYRAPAGRRRAPCGRHRPRHARPAKAAASLPAGTEARWANLTDPAEVDQLIAEVSPTAIVHLAAVIPPRSIAAANSAAGSTWTPPPLCCAPRRRTRGPRASCWPPAMRSTGRAIRIAIPDG